MILYSGEQDIEFLLRSLSTQKYSNFHYIRFNNYSKVDAHFNLYSYINCNSYYDVFIKLDADMAFNGSHCLNAIAEDLAFYSSVNHLIYAVNDFYSQSRIWGMHVFRRGSNLTINMDDLFTDKVATESGLITKKLFSERVDIQHAYYADLDTDFVFGVHRMLKVLQRGDSAYKLYHLYFQLRILLKVYFNFNRRDKNVLRYNEVLLGAKFALDNIDIVKLTSKSQILELRAVSESSKTLSKSVMPDFFGIANFVWSVFRNLDWRRVMVALFKLVGLQR